MPPQYTPGQSLPRPAPQLTGRQLYGIRGLLLAATGDTIADSLLAEAAAITGPVDPPYTVAELGELIALIFRADPRDTGTAEAAPDGPGAVPAHEMPRAALLYPHGQAGGQDGVL